MKNRCKIAAANADNHTWSLAYQRACYAAFVDGYVSDILRLKTQEARLRALQSLPEKFRAEVEAKVRERWANRA